LHYGSLCSFKLALIPAPLSQTKLDYTASDDGEPFVDVSNQLTNNAFMTDYSNLLFSTVLPAFAFPDPKEICE